MPARRIIPVVLSGGSGTRLWPLSRELKPKQLLALVTQRTLIQDTLLRARALGDRSERPIVVCNEAHRVLVAEQLREIGVVPQTIVLEPAGRNTAPAVAIAALLTSRGAEAKAAPKGRAGGKSRVSRDPDPILLVLPADHAILDTDAFVTAVGAAVEAAETGRLVTFGIVPNRPETGFGYLGVGRSHGAWSDVERFVEKPDAATAQRYVDSGKYLWNSGMFVLPARKYLEELERLAPTILAKCRAAVATAETDTDFARLGEEFLDCPADSIDYAVMEKTNNAAVVPLAAGWSDIGSWAALHDVLEKDARGNTLRGDVVAEDCSNTCVVASERLVTAVGLEGVVVVETGDAVLVTTVAHSQRVKQIVEALKKAHRTEVRDAASPTDKRDSPGKGVSVRKRGRHHERGARRTRRGR